MNKEKLRSILSDKYDLASWRQVLTEVFGATGLFQQPKPISLPANDLAESSFELGSFKTSDDRLVGLYQVDLNASVRISQNRVGLRRLLRNIYKYDVDAALVVFVLNDKWRLSLISEIRVRNPETDEVIDQKTEPKRFTYLLGVGETVRTSVDRLDLFRDSDSTLRSLIEAFSVEKLNKDFFRDYKAVFAAFEAEVGRSIQDTETARLFTQSLLNRLMFLYFIQKKGWMKFEGNKNYLRSVFDRAIANRENFYRDRLYWIFFDGLSNQAESFEIQENSFLIERRGEVPYLNGGLFEMEKDGNDEKDKVSLSNELFAELLRVFESYNFTIDESTPFEVQVAVDPEMLGKVFEELVTGRHESGSYYTPRTVVSFMCREALKHALADCDTPESIAKLVDESDGKDIKNPEQILNRLRSIRACDPACGSGAYLLGMLQEMLHIREALFATTAIAKDAQYEWKREIIENSIYGVDMDRFATQIASLRLWLSLAIESDEPKPLPNLKYKIGCGDSLLAPIETIGQGDLHRRALIEQFRARKKEYIDADNHSEKSEAENEIERLRVEIARTLQHLPEPPKPAEILLAERDVQPLKEKIDRLVNLGDKGQAERFQKQLDVLLAHISRLKASTAIENYDTGDIFDWSVEFAEVFEDGGFDIVLANPPYVQQEEIPLETKSRLLAIYGEAMTGKSDLFVAFYARGLQLLKDDGTHVFVCSNSWLDVAYGGKLQGYLLNNSHVAAIYDSAIERQFASADINTIISFIHKKEPDDDDETLFVSLRAPFLEALADETKRRVVTKTSAEIWESGSNENNRYEGDKWGGKYLRAPDIYSAIFDCGNNALVRLGSIVTVNEGRPTGANDFFYVQRAIAAEYQIEDEYLYPGLMKTRGFNRFELRSEHLDRYFLAVDFSKQELNRRKVLGYINQGEQDGLHKRKTFAKKAEWYRFRVRTIAELVSPCGIGATFFCAMNSAGAVASNSYTEFRVNNDRDTILLWGILNSVLVWFQLELLGRSSLGGGLLKVDPIEYRGLKVPALELLDSQRMRIEAVFEILKTRLVGTLENEVVATDRRELDNIVFDALGLTTGERDAVYEAVIDLVSKRLQRAQTVTT